jgi:hypothetical protein
MSATKSNAQNKIETQTASLNETPVDKDTVEVLYQKLGDRWFAFSLVGDQVYIGSVSSEQIDTLRKDGA